MKILRALFVGTLLSSLAPTVQAHSASDAYLTLTTVPDGATVTGQWDIALRDLDFVLALDADGDGRITWREFKARRAAVENYAYSMIVFQADGRACSVKRGEVRIVEHADGAYAALSFEAKCRPSARMLSLEYRLFFAIDPSHRAIVVWRRDADVATAVLSPQVPFVSVKAAGR